jgi:hypothetical protein
VQGRNIPEATFLKLKADQYTLDDFTKEENEEIKSASIAYLQERHGDSYVVEFFRKHLTEVDTYVDRKEAKFLEGTTGGMNIGVYTLLKGKINGVNIAYVRVYCPSSDRLFFLGVNPNNTNAKDAIASLFRIPKKLKDHIDYIQRQGERYSISLTSNGISLLKANMLSNNDLNDIVSIGGDEYFSKMRYEY